MSSSSNENPECVLKGIFSFYSYILIAVAMLAIALASGVTAAESKFTTHHPCCKLMLVS